MKRTIFMWIWGGASRNYDYCRIANPECAAGLFCGALSKDLRGHRRIARRNANAMHGYFDVGFTVVYRRPRAGAPFLETNMSPDHVTRLGILPQSKRHRSLIQNRSLRRFLTLVGPTVVDVLPC